MRIDGKPSIQPNQGETRVHASNREGSGSPFDGIGYEMERLVTREGPDRRSPLPLDSAVVQQTKDRIRQWVDEIHSATARTMDPIEFLRFAMPRILQAMGAEGIGVWAWTPEKHWQLIEASQLPTSLFESRDSTLDHFNRTDDLPAPLANLDQLESQLTSALSLANEESIASQRHQSNSMPPSREHKLLLDEVRKEKQPVLIPPRDVVVSSSRPRNPLGSLLLISPIVTQMDGGELWLEILQPPSGGPASQRGYLRFASQMSELMAEYFKQHRTRLLEQERRFLASTRRLLDSFSSQPHASLAVALQAIQSEVQAEHVVLMRRQRNAWRVTALAGVERLDRRSDAIRETENVAAAIDRESSGEPLFDAGTESRVTDSQWRQSLGVERYAWLKPFAVDSTRVADGSATIPCLLDSSLSRPTSETNTPDLGVALLITWPPGVIPQRDYAQRASLTLKLLAKVPSPSNPLRNVERTDRFAFVRSLLRVRTLAVTGLLLAILGILAIPVPIQIETTATLAPQSVQEIFAPEEGVVTDVLVRHGQRVKAGDICVQMSSPKLIAEKDQTLAAHAKTEQRQREVNDRLLRDRSLSPQQRDALESERTALEEIHALELSTLALIESQCNSLSVIAPRDGIIETWDIESNLRDRPLRLGQWLFTIRDESSGWVFETDIPEHKLEELNRSSNKTPRAFARLLASPQSIIPLELDKSIPWRTQRFSSESVQSTSKRESLVSIKLKPNGPIPIDLAMTGAGARVAIETGRGPLGWALVKDFVQDLIYRMKMWIP